MVSALAVFDDGQGPALYAGGSFVEAGGVPSFNIARWDGSSWQPVGGGVSSQVKALEVYDDGGGLTSFDDGTGPALYVAGRFNFAGGLLASHVARWDGTFWRALGRLISADDTHQL